VTLVAYSPSPERLDRYARVLVRLALGSGRGIKRGDVVLLSGGDDAKSLYVAVRDEVIRAGGHVIGDYSPSGTSRSALELASMEQLMTFHRDYYRGLARTLDHRIAIISTVDFSELDGVDPQKLLAGRRVVRPYRNWMAKKEAEGRYTWTLGLFGTPAMARQARLTLAEYWDEIAKACFLDDADPIRRWREVFREIARIKRRLDALAIEQVHVEGEGVDLRVTIGEQRCWMGGTGRNIPSFEIFVSPDWRGVEGTVAFTEPLSRYGGMLEGIRLTFERGRVVEATASRNEKLLRAMIASDAGSSAVGEFSLTDGRLSPITRYMAQTLFDENRGGPEGNFHIALGNAYRDSFAGDVAALTARDLKRLGFNESAVHTDIVSTARRTVTALLPSGRTKVIYRDGRFTI
jgi:aminopeptidase